MKFIFIYQGLSLNKLILYVSLRVQTCLFRKLWSQINDCHQDSLEQQETQEEEGVQEIKEKLVLTEILDFWEKPLL